MSVASAFIGISRRPSPSRPPGEDVDAVEDVDANARAVTPTVVPPRRRAMDATAVRNMFRSVRSFSRAFVKTRINREWITSFVTRRRASSPASRPGRGDKSDVRIARVFSPSLRLSRNARDVDGLDC